MWTCCEGLERSSLTWKISTCFVFCWVFFSGWLALFRWLGINTLHYFGERHWNAYLIALLTMMAVIIVWLNPRCFLSLLFFSEKKNEVHIESQKGAGLYLIILLSRHLNGCALFFVNVKEEYFFLKKTYNKPSTC